MAHAMRCACVDIGTNTTRLLVAEPDGAGGLREVARLRHFLRLRPRPGGALEPETIAQVADAVAAQAHIARGHGACRVRVVATAAIRAASNGDALCAAVRAASGSEVVVLTGEQEARLAFAGATRMLPADPPGLVGVVDVGGGSSELVAGTVTGGVTWWASFPLGSGVLTERHLRSDPPTPDELDAVAPRSRSRCRRWTRRAPTSRSRSAAAPPRWGGSSGPSSRPPRSPARSRS